jgi:hypothetical protein
MLKACDKYDVPAASIDTLKKHWASECIAIDLVCSVCSGVLKRNEIQFHRCDAGLVRLIQQLKQRVAELEKENKELKARPQP